MTPDPERALLEWRVAEVERMQRETDRLVESLSTGHEMMGEEMDGEIARRLRLEERVEALEGGGTPEASNGVGVRTEPLDRHQVYHMVETGHEAMVSADEYARAVRSLYREVERERGKRMHADMVREEMEQEMRSAPSSDDSPHPTPSSDEGEPEIRPKDPWTCSSKEERPMAVAQRDLAAILRALGLGDHARVVSPHDVVHQEVLPEIRRLVEERDRLQDDVKMWRSRCEDMDRLLREALDAALDISLTYLAGWYRKRVGEQDAEIRRLRREVERLREDAQSDREEADGFKHHLDHLLHEIFQAEPSYSDATVEEVISDAVFEVDSLRWKVRDLEEEAERLRSGGRIEVTAGAVEVAAQWLNKRESRFAWEDLTKESKEHYERQAELLLDDSAPYLSIQPPEDGGGEPEYGRSRIAEVREQEESEPSEDAPGSEGEPHEAGRCTRCGGPIYHRPGKPGEFDHDWGACDPQPTEAPERKDAHQVFEAVMSGHEDTVSREEYARAIRETYPRSEAPEGELAAAARDVLARLEAMMAMEGCECEPPGHHCGKPDAEREVRRLRAALERPQPTEAPEGEDPWGPTKDDLHHARGCISKEAAARTAINRARARIERHYRPRRVPDEDVTLITQRGREHGAYWSEDDVREVLDQAGLHLPGEEGR